MSIGKLATALTVIFAISAAVLVAELLFVLRRRRRSSRLRSSQSPISGNNQHHDPFPTSYCFFRLKSQTRVEPSGAPAENPNRTSPEDPVIDVFKLLEANGPSRFLCTIKEDDREYVGSTSMSVVDSLEVPPETEIVSLKACLEAEAAEEKAVKVEDTKTVMFSPCDSPMFFTPAGSPSRDGFVSSITGDSCGGGGGGGR
ncbi:hypothetical protein L1987_61034 [Smallanthus sonchifolius]|uniref:Uncharacterized protein n=1 Tax=Smallanthus sonchifolius TaxID=185202 RepID=A0ACB9D9V9_9ASTR|nr:hypothetical protein L1987_61034 [Smallanthus sonchifolius]